MLARALTTAFTLAALASADVVPTGPTPGDTFNEGANCLIQYDVDTTGTWGNTTIQLMSGSNLDMVVVADVVTGLDGSTGGVINWECPDVTPNSQIYFYQYSAPGQATSWTGRFTIASATGDSTDPANSTTTGGVTVNYGYGALTDPSETIAAPIISGGVTGSGSSATSRASGSSAATSSAASSSASSSASSAASSSSSEAQSSSESESAATVTSTEASSSSSGSSSSSSSSASSAASSAAASSTPASGAASLQIGGALSALVGLVGIIALA